MCIACNKIEDQSSMTIEITSFVWYELYWKKHNKMSKFNRCYWFYDKMNVFFHFILINKAI